MRPPPSPPPRSGYPPPRPGPPPPGPGYDDHTQAFRARQNPPPPPHWQHPGPQNPQRPVAPPRQAPPNASRQPPPWPAPPPRPSAEQPPANWSYAEGVRTTDLAPTRKLPPGRGWRQFLYRATFGLVNPGRSPDELRQAALEDTVRTLLRGHYKIGVLGKGGVGKTTVAATVGSLFAELRPEDRVVAIDADTAFGRLGSRIDPRATGSYWELIHDDHLETFSDVRSRVGNNAAGLYVLPGEATGAKRRRVLDPATYREAATRLDRYFAISVVDCGSTVDSPVTQEVLRDLDAMIVVSSPWIDGASAAGQTMEWLADRSMTGLLHCTVVVLNDSDGHADKRTRSTLAQQFRSRGHVVVEVPFDSHLRPGGVLDTSTDLAPSTRRRMLEVAASIAERFTATTQRARPFR
ncbi:MAG TPA: MinD/ParA family protein [Mycobacterium sp.]|nr:MinD/ParA family protein [Mycobacterium sp.]HME48754.1 MinD/ParA family protein [Mycobacterium sp.]